MRKKRVRRRVRILALVTVCIAILASSCIGLGTHEQLLTGGDETSQELGREFTLISWNIAKAEKASGFVGELSRSPNGASIVCLQEWEESVPLKPIETLGYSGDLGASWEWLGGAGTTGVATFSSSVPRRAYAQRSAWREAWILTPKCVLLTEYAIAGSTETLLVANVHAMNFQPVFTYMLREQIATLAQIISTHRGPAIVCGDFNTWRGDRMRVVQSELRGAGLEEVKFRDRRPGAPSVVWIIGGSSSLPLDRVFYRGLQPVGEGQVLDAKVDDVDVSDHRPLKVLFRVES